MKSRFSSGVVLILVTLFAFILQGYHPGAEDDGIYLSAVKLRLHPVLYPFNREFITLQMQATVYDKVIAVLVRWSHVPVSYFCLLSQLAGIAFLLLGYRYILAFCFTSFRARLGGILTVACLLSLSVAGTALYISDEHLHPRLIATDFILFALSFLQRGRYTQAVLCLAAGIAFHPIMGVFGISLCLLYQITPRLLSCFNPATSRMSLPAVAFPGWLFAPANSSWQLALHQHSYYRLGGWQWYELLGAIAPPFLLCLLARLGRMRQNAPYHRLAATLALYSTLQFGVALLILLPEKLERLSPLQPMRYLHLTFLLMALLGGAALAEYLLRERVWLWLLVFVPLAGVNGYAQRLRYPSTQNLEFPWSTPSSDWTRAFAWIRQNTPTNAVFALDPEYLSLPGEDNHSFRALAERSSLADARKDAAVVTQVPQLGDAWYRQYKKQQGWQSWTVQDFQQLARETPVRWLLVARLQATGLVCPYSNASLSVCRISGNAQPAAPLAPQALAP